MSIHSKESRLTAVTTTKLYINRASTAKGFGTRARYLVVTVNRDCSAFPSTAEIKKAMLNTFSFSFPFKTCSLPKACFALEKNPSRIWKYPVPEHHKHLIFLPSWMPTSTCAEAKATSSAFSGVTLTFILPQSGLLHLHSFYLLVAQKIMLPSKYVDI